MNVHHVGSTSVEGLCAKPKIDIIAVVKERKGIQEALEQLGYQWRGEFNIPFHMGYSKRPPLLNVNLHVYQQEDPQIELNLLFRDTLRENPGMKEEYAKLKEELILNPASHLKEKNRFTGYNLSKDAFIKRVLKKRGFNRICLHFCMHHQEWNFAKKMIHAYQLDALGEDKHEVKFLEREEDCHFVLYSGVELVGYAHFVFLSEKEAELQFFRIDESYRHQGFGQQLLLLCQQWFQLQGVEKLCVPVHSFIESFLLNQGFQKDQENILVKSL